MSNPSKDINEILDNLSTAVMDIEEAIEVLDATCSNKSLPEEDRGEIVCAKELAQSSRDLCLSILKSIYTRNKDEGLE